MRKLISLAVIVSAAFVARGPRSAVNADARVLRVMTFNIQHGIDGSHKYNLQRAIDVIAKIQPDVVGLQEVTRNHPYYNCDDQPAKIAAGLRSATGRTWAVAYEQEWFTPNVECRDGGRGDGKETEGLALLAPGDTLGPTSATPLPVSRIAFAVRLASAGGLPIVVTHLASGATNADARHREIDALVRWTDSLGLQRQAGRHGNATAADDVPGRGWAADARRVTNRLRSVSRRRADAGARGGGRNGVVVRERSVGPQAARGGL